MANSNNESLVLIDYEYAGWNPLAYDIANFCNECAVELAGRIHYYFDNFPTQEERMQFCKFYCEHWYENYNKSIETFEQFWEEKWSKLEREIEVCILINCLFWTA